MISPSFSAAGAAIPLFQHPEKGGTGNEERGEHARGIGTPSSHHVAHAWYRVASVSFLPRLGERGRR